MSEGKRLRTQVEKLRLLARMADDVEIERRITALGDEYGARAVKAESKKENAKPRTERRNVN